MSVDENQVGAAAPAVVISCLGTDGGSGTAQLAPMSDSAIADQTATARRMAGRRGLVGWGGASIIDVAFLAGGGHATGRSSRGRVEEEARKTDALRALPNTFGGDVVWHARNSG